jgi:hypothetical protein
MGRPVRIARTDRGAVAQELGGLILQSHTVRPEHPAVDSLPYVSRLL